ncbi:MAG: acyl carrier protein [Flavobacteriales bacterium]|nr:acyl carrier protein [Flavobacteriales bacterium]
MTMRPEEIKDRIRTVLTAVLGHTNFSMEDGMTAADVKGWDSLTHMQIITRVEKEFAVRFKLKEINKLKNMGSLVELITSKLIPDQP